MKDDELEDRSGQLSGRYQKIGRMRILEVGLIDIERRHWRHLSTGWQKLNQEVTYLGT